jgi:two-component system OmpR family response regulator
VRLTLIEADADGAGWLAPRLSGDGFRVARVPLSQQFQALAGEAPDAALLDMGSTRLAASAIVRGLRDRGLDRPLLVVSGSGDWRDRVASLDAGADDFLVKPVRAEEVAARLRAVIRRAVGHCCERIRAGDVELDLRARAAWLEGEALDLTRDEFRLLRLLALNPGGIHSNDDIRDALYPQGEARSGNAVEVRIARLRRKIGRGRIRTVRGLGYRLEGVEEGREA